MKKAIWISLITAFVLVGCKPSGSDNAGEWAQKVGEKMCAKMGECTKEMLKSLPKTARGRAMSHMFSEERCLENMKKRRKKNKDKLSQIKLSAEEIKLAQACLKEIEGTRCVAMRRMNMKSCEKMGEIFDAKRK